MEEPTVNNNNSEIDINGTQNKEKLREAKGVDSVTDYVPEVETTDSEKALAAAAAVDVMNNAKATESAVITILEDDIKLIVDECEVTKEAAEALLRANGGILKSALISFVRGKNLM
eukprot:gene5942-8190_t